MLTTRDIIKLKEIFVTKEEFSTRFESLENGIMTKLDMIVGELQAMRDEMTIVVYRQAEHSDGLENHDQRLTSLEIKIIPSKA